MPTSPYPAKNPPPRDGRDKPRVTAEPRSANSTVRMDEGSKGRDESLEEPGYGHGV